MGNDSVRVTPDNSDEESGKAFTDGDFDDSDDDGHVNDISNTSQIPINETVNMELNNTTLTETNGANGRGNGNAWAWHEQSADVTQQMKLNGTNGGENGLASGMEDRHEFGTLDLRKDSHGELNPSIVGILGGQQNHAEQRLAARRAARAEAREIRMRELERQQREQEDHADKAYDMYAETVTRRGTRLTAAAALSSGGVHSPRRSSEDSAEDSFSVKDLRHELKEVEEKFRKAMILNAQLDNDKAAFKYQLELLKDRLEEMHEEYAQLQREHKEKCSAHERLKREHASLEREVCAARDAVRARDAAAAAAGYAFVEAALAPVAPAPAAVNGEPPPPTSPGGAGADAPGFGSVPPLALVSHDSEQLLNDAGEGTLDVRLQKLLSGKQALESEVRKLKLTLNEERAARHNGVANHDDMHLENELETLRKSLTEAKARAARAEAEAALQAAGAARLEAQAARLRAHQQHQDEHEEQLKQERRRLQRETREALIRVEELETENSHLTKRLDKLKNAKSALLKDL